MLPYHKSDHHLYAQIQFILTKCAQMGVATVSGKQLVLNEYTFIYWGKADLPINVERNVYR